MRATWGVDPPAAGGQWGFGGRCGDFTALCDSLQLCSQIGKYFINLIIITISLTIKERLFETNLFRNLNNRKINGCVEKCYGEMVALI